MTTEPTYFSESEQRPIPIRDRQQMPDRRLEATINKVARGDDTQTLFTLREERTRREALGDWNPGGSRSDVALPRTGAIGDNNPPSDDEAMRQRLEESHGDLIAKAAELEIAASKLPKEVQSDEDVAAISAWVIRAQNLGKKAEKDRVDAKEPYLRAGQAVDKFFSAMKAGLASRINGLEARKTPYLKAKRDREEAEAQQRIADERKRQQEAEAEAAKAREERDKLQAQADEAAAALRGATTSEEAARLEEQARGLNAQAAAASDAVHEAVAEQREADRSLERAEKAADGAALGKIDAGGATSGLETVWAPDIHNRTRFIAGLGPLGPFFTDKELETALIRASKANPRPAVPGVDWIPEDKVTTKAARG